MILGSLESIKSLDGSMDTLRLVPPNATTAWNVQNLALGLMDACFAHPTRCPAGCGTLRLLSLAQLATSRHEHIQTSPKPPSLGCGFGFVRRDLCTRSPRLLKFEIMSTPKNCAPGEQKLAWKNLQQHRLADPMRIEHDALQEAG